MKTNHPLCLFFLPALFLITGCNGGKAGMTAPKASVAIVHFKDPVYTKNLIVWGNENTEFFDLTRGNQCERTYLTASPRRDTDGSILGASGEFNFPERYRDPFWALPDGWYLIDWAWCNLADQAYPDIGHTILTEVTFDNFYDYGTCVFDKSIPHITLPREEIFVMKRIYIGDLMAYMHPDGNYPSFKISLYDDHYEKDTIYVCSNQYFFHECLWHIPVASNVRTCLCGLADQMDEYWAVLQNQLTTLINNGDLDKLKHFDTKSLFIDQ